MAVFFELGLNRRGRLRADVLALSMKRYVIVVEVKSSVADFKADHKMEGYLEFCHKMYVAMPASVASRVTVPKGVGVFVCSEDGKTIDRVVAARGRNIPDDTVFSIAIRAAFRDSDSSTRANKNATTKDD